MLSIYTEVSMKLREYFDLVNFHIDKVADRQKMLPVGEQSVYKV